MGANVAVGVSVAECSVSAAVIVGCGILVAVSATVCVTVGASVVVGTTVAVAECSVSAAVAHSAVTLVGILTVGVFVGFGSYTSPLAHHANTKAAMITMIASHTR